jgi:hypothetical protein
MVAGKIVEINDELFALSEPAAQLFANEDEASKIAYLSQYIGMLGEVETHVVDCFYKGVGVPYNAFSRFQDVMAEDSGQNIVAALPDHILPLVPGLTTALQNGSIAENRDHPLGPLLYTISCMHCMTTSLSQGGMDLGAMWSEQRALQFLKSAGFTDIEIRTLEHDIQNNY